MRIGQPQTFPSRSALVTTRPRELPSTHRFVAWPLLAVAALLLAGCGGVRNGYPNHVVAPSLAEPGTTPHDNKDVYLQLIHKLQQQGAYYASLAHIDAYRQRYGDSPELSQLRADALRETGQGNAAVPIYQSLLHSSQAAAAWHGLGLIAAAANQQGEAEQDLAKAVQLEPINSAYLSDLGYARLRAGRIAEAREPLSMAAQLAPDDAKDISNLAVWAILDNQLPLADDLMQRAKLPQTTRDAVYQLAAQLRASIADNAAAPTAETATAATAAETASTSTAGNASGGNYPHRVPVPNAINGIPGGVLDRFSSSSSSTSGANP
ncbi:Flp pilus assembly protein TadD [Rhodanobacter sp. DHG33]|uniref:Flp pilus assembly protein TadD n=1 Tax=Rhodanobacter sp. DHG33 TaxID=2775921 RepID=UPI00177BB739|nr:Flp pilus assembly protein TadD [Rhodanobacter sp. DHG33]MBD8898944.1 Flp pilus assembly protein TadD [Rhodanobacter sp. DHG33]